MFIGHNGLGFALKRVAPKVSLTSLFTAVQLPDLLWPILLSTGTEAVQPVKGSNGFLNLEFVSYPYSHSLLSNVILALAFGIGWRFLGPSRSWSSAGLLSVAVLSHWLLDWVTHIPDLPLTLSGEAKFGLGLWRSMPLTFTVEVLLFAIGTALYAKHTRAKSRGGSVALWLFVALMGIIYVANAMGPPPPRPEAVAYVGLSSWLLVLWAYWMDCTRSQAALKVR